MRLLTIGKPAWTARPKTRAPNETADAAVERIRRHENARAYHNGQCIILPQRSSPLKINHGSRSALVRTWRRTKPRYCGGTKRFRATKRRRREVRGSYLLCGTSRYPITAPLTSTLSLPQLVSQDVNGFEAK